MLVHCAEWLFAAVNFQERGTKMGESPVSAALCEWYFVFESRSLKLE